jgi:hypothetical protein
MFLKELVSINAVAISSKGQETPAPARFMTFPAGH